YAVFSFVHQVTRQQLRDVLHNCDQLGIEERKRRRLHRRVYNVQAPNHLWHLDTNHKLIRWHFVIAGGIDGFSRYIVFLNCANNNKSQTILHFFKDGENKCGTTPLRVRTDKGQENIKVAEYMIQKRGMNRRTVIAGKSTHNQRIERLWRDVYDGVLCYFYELFYFMEEHGILNPSNTAHIYALHYVYLGKINEKLDIWKEAWQRHRLRTARSSPLRLFWAGSVTCPVDVPLSDTEADLYGTEGDVEETDGDDLEDNIRHDSRPSFDPVQLDINWVCQQELETVCRADWVSENHGIDIFLLVVDVLRRHTDYDL
ncbi:uncharacterized protein, partial [Littorina saxatilis]|uniref:uncharacterized protein n=1 Tax=Littorina saxatilis TaxID=31220 RepID=UPI0038B46E0F